MAIITSHGLDFDVETQGFGHFEADRDIGIEAIQSHLDHLPADVVAAAHAECKSWMADDCEGDRPSLYDALEVIGHKAATVNWHNPNAVMFMVSAH